MIDALPTVGTGTPLPNMLSSLSAKINPNANVDAAAKEFEAMFAAQLLKPMFDTVPVNKSFGGGNGEEVMRSFLIQEYGKFIAKSGALGIASQVKAEMLRAQENADARKGRASKQKSLSPYESSVMSKGSNRVAAQ